MRIGTEFTFPESCCSNGSHESKSIPREGAQRSSLSKKKGAASNNGSSQDLRSNSDASSYGFPDQ